MVFRSDKIATERLGTLGVLRRYAFCNKIKGKVL